MTVTACTTVISNAPKPVEYTKQEQVALAKELEDKCPLTKDKYGNEIHTCPMIDRAIHDYGTLRKQLRITK